MKKNVKKGFTLVELLVVIAILAILATVSVVGYTAFIEKANKSNAENELHQIATAIEADMLDDGMWQNSEYVIIATEAGFEAYTWEDTNNDGVVEKTEVTVTDSIDLEKIADFAELEGTLSVSEGKLSYLYNGVTVTHELKSSTKTDSLATVVQPEQGEAGDPTEGSETTE